MRQILALYNNKRMSIEENAIKAFYKPFEDVSESGIVDYLNNMDKLLRLKDYETAVCILLMLYNFKASFYTTPFLISETYVQKSYQHFAGRIRVLPKLLSKHFACSNDCIVFWMDILAFNCARKKCLFK